MTLVVFSLVIAVALTAGSFVIACVVALRHGDSSATYPLYAFRDKLIHRVVFDGHRRDDPWLQAMYDAANTVLVGAAVMSGPLNWPKAQIAGRHLARRRIGGEAPLRFPAEPLPADLEPLLGELQAALNSLQRFHFGWGLFFSSQRREQARMRLEQAKVVGQQVRALHASLQPTAA